MSKKRSHLIDKSYSFINDQSKEFSVRSQNKKQILVFPSSISDLPLTSFSKYQSFSNKNIAKSNKLKKNDKTNGKLSIDGINNILSNLSKTNNNNKKLKLHKPKNVIYTSQYDSNRTKCFSPSSSEKISENNILNNSIISNNTSNISLSATAITATKKNDRTEKQCFFDPYCDSVLRNVGVTIRDTISNTIINQREESQYPMKCIESNAFKEIRCSMFHPPTSDNFSETNETDVIENMHKKILSTRNFENNSRENIDYSILSFLTKNRSRLQNDTDLHKNDRHSCKIKYSWQVIGTGSQTSQTLLDSLVKENTLVDDEPICNCSIKYSWQIIGIATQTAPSDFTTSECRSAISLLSAKTNTIHHTNKETYTLPTATVWRKGKRYIILNNQCLQTSAHKESQTIFTELYEKYHD